MLARQCRKKIHCTDLLQFWLFSAHFFCWQLLGEQGDEEVDMTDIWSTTWMAWRTYYKVEEMRWEALGGAQVSPLLRGFSPATFCWFCCFVGVFLVFCFWFCSVFLAGEKTPASNSSFTLFCYISRVDRPCPVLARQCRKKKVWVPRLQLELCYLPTESATKTSGHVRKRVRALLLFMFLDAVLVDIRPIPTHWRT